MCQSIPQAERIERLVGLPLKGTSARLRRVLGLERLEAAFAKSATNVSATVQRKLERLCGVSLPSARRRRIYRGLGIEQLEQRLLLTTITWDGGGTTNNWSDAANWSTNTIPTSVDDVVFDGTSLKNVVVNGSSTLTVHDILITNAYSGSISLSTGLNVTGNLSEAGGTFSASNRALSVTGNLNLTGGQFTASSATTTLSGNATIAGATFNANGGTISLQGGDKSVNAAGAAFNNMTLNLGAGGDLTVVGTMDVNGNLRIQGNTTSTLAGGNVTVAGNVTTTNTGFKGAGTIVFDGTGNQNFTGTGMIGNVAIQKSSGTLTLQNTISVDGNWQYVSGTVNAGTSTVVFVNGDKMVAASGMSFNNVTLNLAAGGDLTVIGIMDVNGSLVIQGSTTSTLAAGTITVAGNLTDTNTGFSGAGSIVVDGAGNQSLSAGGGTGLLSNLTVQKSAGTLSVANGITISNSFSLISGAVAVTGTLDVNGNMSVLGSGSSSLTSGTVTVAGNLTTTNTGFTGAGTIVLDGTGNQLLSAAGGIGQVGRLTIQKGSGTLSIADTIEVDGNFTYVSGTVDAGTSTVVFQNGDKTVNATGMSFNNVTFDLGAGGDLTVSGTLDVNGNLLIAGNTTSTLAGGTATVAGNLTTTNTGFTGAGTIRLDGAGNQLLSAAGGVGQVGNLTVQKAGGILSIADTIEIWGNLTVSSGTINAGTSTLVFQGGDKTANVGSAAFNNVVFDLASGGDLTVTGTLDITGNLTIQGNTTSTLAAGTVTVAGDLTTTNNGFAGAGTIRLDGAGNQLLSAASGIGQVGNLVIQKSGGTLSIADTIEIFGTLTGVSGTVDAGTSTVVFQGNDKTINVSGIAFHDVVFDLNNNGDLTVSGTLDVNGNLLIKGGTATTQLGGTVAIAGNITNTNTAFLSSGTFLLDGAGDQTFSGSAQTIQLNHLTINKSAGTVFLNDTIKVTGNLQKIAGAVDAGSSTVIFQGGDKTVNAAGVAFHNVVFNLSSGGDLTVVGTLDVDGNLAINGSTSSTLQNGIVTVAGNVTTTNIGFTGTGTILLDGAGDQTLSAAGGIGQVGNITVQKTGGTLFLADTIEIVGNLLVNSGVVDGGTSTVEFQGGDKTVNATGATFHNVVFNLGSGGDLTVVGTMDVDGNLTVKGSTSSKLQGGTVAVAGNVTTTNTGFSGTGTILLDGAGDQTLSASGGIGQISNLTIQKSGGTLFLNDTIEIVGNVVYVSGTVDTGTSTIEFQGGDKTVNANGIAFHNVVFNLGSGGDLTVVGTMDVDGNLTVKGSTSSTLQGGVVAVAGNVTTTNAGFRGTGTILLDGAGDQTLSALGGIGQISNLTIQKSGGTLFLNDTIEIVGNVLYVSGTVDSGMSTVEFQGSNQTVDANGFSFHNVVINLGAGGSLTVVGGMDVDGNLAINGSNASTFVSGTISIAGDFTCQNGNFISEGTLELNGTGNQILTFTTMFQGDLTINKLSGIAQLTTDFIISGSGHDLRILAGAFDAAGHTVSVDGTFEFSASTFTLNGNLTIGIDGTLSLSLAGFNSGEYQKLIVTGALTLGDNSHLKIDLAGITAAGTALDIIHFGSLAGQFANVDVLNAPENHNIELVYDLAAGSMNLAVTEILPAASAFPLFSLHRHDAVQQRLPATTAQPSVAGPSHFVTSPKSHGELDTREEFDPPEPLVDNVSDENVDELNNLEEFDEENLASESDDTNSPADQDGSAEETTVIETTSPVFEYGAEDQSPESSAATTSEDAVSDRLDALEDLFTAFAWDELDRTGGKQGRGAEQISFSTDGSEQVDASFNEIALLAAIVTVGAALPAASSVSSVSSRSDSENRPQVFSG